MHENHAAFWQPEYGWMEAILVSFPICFLLERRERRGEKRRKKVRRVELKEMSSMDGSRGPASAPSHQDISAETLPLFVQGISLILSRWTALQMAIKNEWGGRDPGQRMEQLVSVLRSWFVQSRGGSHDIEDLENTLDEFMVLSFNAEIEDGSIEDVAEQLMMLYEDCLQENYELIERLRLSNDANHPSLPQSRLGLRQHGHEQDPV